MRFVLGRRYVRFCVKSYRLRNVEEYDLLYDVLSGIGGSYTYECNRGKCISVLTVPREYSELILSIPDLEVDTGKCGEGPLLPPPRGRAIRGPQIPARSAAAASGIVVGTAGSRLLRLSVDYAYKHILILGSTGSGKTHTAARLAYCLAEHGITVVVFDWHGEYDKLIPAARVYRGDRLPRVALLAEELAIDESLSILEYVLELTPYQSTLLMVVLASVAGLPLHSISSRGIVGEAESKNREEERKGSGSDEFKVIERVFSSRKWDGASISELASALLDAYGNVKDSLRSQAENEVWLALMRRLNSIAFTSYSNLFIVKGRASLPIDKHGVIVLDLSGIKSVRIRRLYALLLAHQLYASTVKGEASDVILVVDEAHHLVSSRTIQEIVAEARKYRLGVIAATHSPSSVPYSVLANFNSIIVHRLVSAEDKQLAAQLLGDKSLVSILPKLEPGEAIVHTPSLEKPVIVKIDTKLPCS